MSATIALVIWFALDIAMLMGMIYLDWPITGIILFLMLIPQYSRIEQDKKD